MCGRFAITAKPEDLRNLFGYVDQPNFPPRFNIAPTQPVPVVTIDQGQRRFVLMRWGFIPGWVKDPKEFPLVFNIRSETAREKASFRAAFIRRRALMPADGFYEWKREGRISTPFFVRKPGGESFAFPALWETWTSPDGSEIDTVGLITAAATPPLSTVHSRTPVILEPANWNEWLDPSTSPDRAAVLLAPPEEGSLELRRVGPAINKVDNDRPEVQDEATEADISPPVAKPAPKKARREDDGQGSLF
jgi:putative SOS response-associated peptidase YedK